MRYSLYCQQYVAKESETILEGGDNNKKWESNALSTSDGTILIVRWVVKVVDSIGRDEQHCHKLIEDNARGMTAGGTEDRNLIDLEGHEEGNYTFENVEPTLDRLDDLILVSPPPADEVYLLVSSQ